MCGRNRSQEHQLRVGQKQDWDQGFILFLFKIAVLSGTDVGSDGVEQHRVLSIKTVTRRAPCGFRRLK